MDVVVSNIPPKFGMMLSRSWTSNLKGTLHMDMSYATIPLFGDHRRLYREKRLEYVASSQDKTNNHPICVVDTDMVSSIFFNDSHIEKDFPIVDELKQDK